MTDGPAGPTDGPAVLAAGVRDQADGCARLGSSLYAALLRRAADDLLSGGPVAEVLAGSEGEPRDAHPELRLLAGVHRLVLERRAPALALHYPSVGGRPGAEDDLWTAFRDTVAAHVPELRAGMGTAVQTNEVGRSAPLLGGLLHLVAAWELPVRLVEIGASAGLNLRADAFRYLAADGASYGPADSPLVLADAWSALPHGAGAPVHVVERVGTDVAPVDPTTTEGRLRLTSFVWPDQVQRLERLRGALAVAARVPAALSRASAVDTVRALDLAAGAWTVLWHSVMWQYVDPPEQEAVLARIEDLGATATATRPFAHLRFEPLQQGVSETFSVVATTWPGGAEQVLGTALPHGLPVRWAGAGSG